MRSPATHAPSVRSVSKTFSHEWFRDLDKKLAEEIAAPEDINRISQFFFHDYEIKCDVLFHFIYHNFMQYSGYKTFFFLSNNT